MENPGVMSNPTLEKLHEGIKIARENNVDQLYLMGVAIQLRRMGYHMTKM